MNFAEAVKALVGIFFAKGDGEGGIVIDGAHAAGGAFDVHEDVWINIGSFAESGRDWLAGVVLQRVNFVAADFKLNAQDGSVRCEDVRAGDLVGESSRHGQKENNHQRKDARAHSFGNVSDGF